jgi:glutamate racemase
MIGIFDSGVGGLSVYFELKKLSPEAAVVYFSDHANFPFGEKTQPELLQITMSAVKKLMEYKTNPIVVACNSATVSTIDQLRESFPTIMFVGVEPAVKIAVSETENGHVGVLATKKTVLMHDSESLAQDTIVHKHYAPELISQIENDVGKITDDDIRKSLEPLLSQGIDTLVLGCSHFYFLKERIRALNPSLHVIEPSKAVAERVISVLDGKIETGKDIFLTSGDVVAFQRFLLSHGEGRDYDVRQV